MKKIIAITAMGIVVGAQGALVVGDRVNFDFGTGNGTPGAATYAGPVNTGYFNLAGVFTGPGGQVDSVGNAVNIGSYRGAGIGSKGAAGALKEGTDLVGEDYVWVGGDLSGATLNGKAVGSFRRMTLFTNKDIKNGLEDGQVWNITFMGGGNVAGQGLNIDLNNNGTIISGSVPGANQGGPWAGYTADNTITFSNVSVSLIAGGAELEFWIWVPADAENQSPASFSAISGIQMELVATPKPNTIGLLTAFGIGMLFIARRHTV